MLRGGTLFVGMIRHILAGGSVADLQKAGAIMGEARTKLIEVHDNVPKPS
jgi:hypothetical protein